MVSVCIATYNGGKYILAQLESILVQLDPEDEVVISDDLSNDNTIELIKSLGDSRIKILSGIGFGGPIYNFENALKHANGDYIFLSDQDDIWMPGKKKIMTDRLNSGFDLVISDCEIVDEELDLIHPSYFSFNKSGRGIIRNLIKNSYMGCCMAFSEKLLNSCLPFPSNLPMHDSYIGLVAELKFKVDFLPTPLLLHRKHSANSSNTSTGRSNYSIAQKIMFRINIIIALLTVLIHKKKRNEII